MEAPRLIEGPSVRPDLDVLIQYQRWSAEPCNPYCATVLALRTLATNEHTGIPAGTSDNLQSDNYDSAESLGNRVAYHLRCRASTISSGSGARMRREGGALGAPGGVGVGDSAPSTPLRFKGSFFGFADKRPPPLGLAFVARCTKPRKALIRQAHVRLPWVARLLEIQ